MSEGAWIPGRARCTVGVLGRHGPTVGERAPAVERLSTGYDVLALAVVGVLLGELLDELLDSLVVVVEVDEVEDFASRESVR